MTEPLEPPGTAREPSPAPVLRRSRSDRVIAGVSGGLGRYVGIEPVLIRIAFVLLVFAGGAGILLYVIGWIAIPEEREGEPVGRAEHGGGGLAGGGAELVGIALVALGAFFLLREVFPDVFDGRYVWPVLLIVIGAAILLRGVRR